MNYKRIYILYSERSGSNLLRLLLGNHPELSAPVSPQLFDSFSAYVDRFGDLKNPKNTKKLISLMIEFVNHPFSDWKLNATAEDIYSIRNPEDFASIIDAIYLAKAREDNKPGYVCKENHLFDYSALIQNSIENINWVYLYRDPRDVVNSWLKNKVLFFTPYRAAKSWAKEQTKCMGLNLSHGLPYKKISYEDMITDTERHIADVLSYVGLQIDERCFQNTGGEGEAQRNVLWKNLNKPIDSTNKNKYRTGLKEKKIEIVETVCYRQMKKLGYKLETNYNWKPLLGSNYGYAETIKNIVLKKFSGHKETSSLISDRDKLKKELIKSL